MSVSGVMASPVNDKKVVVKSADKSAEYAVKSVRSIKFSGGDIIMNFYDGVCVAWNSNAVDGMFFYYNEPDETLVNSLTEQDFTFNGGMLVVESAAPIDVTLSTVEGKVVVNTICKGSLSFDLGGYPQGIYILKINGSTYKIVNR